MTDEELMAIEARVAERERDATCCGYTDETRLVAEVRRLRGLVKRAEFGCVDDYGRFCPWCDDGGDHEPERHAANCPAFTPSGDVR